MNYISRASYGRLLEPPGSGILHGAGQSPEEFLAYGEAVQPYRPLLYMTYFGLRGNANAFFAGLRAKLEELRQPDVILQIGLSITKDGSPELHYEHEVADGKYDEHIQSFCRELIAWNRPVFIRIGYEFNGHWNGYEADAYRSAWRRIAGALREHGVRKAALVWCFAADGRNKDFRSYYPGNEHVDWWGVDLFDPSHFSSPHVLEFMREAEKREYPVMIGECTPRRVGVLQGEESWRLWFEPFFQFIAGQPSIKAFCYISWNWASYPQWADWGNGRIGDNDEVRSKFVKQLSLPWYVHG